MHEIRTSPFIKNLKTKTGKTFDDVLVGFESHYFWKDKNGKIFTEHPKFSINTGISPYLVDYHPEDIPNNLYFSAYYCQYAAKNGVSMETSSAIGLRCGEKILKDIGLKNKRKIFD